MKRIIASLSLVGLLMGGSLHYAYAHSGDNFISPIGTPVIDGVQDGAEWDSAVQIPVFTTFPGPGTLFIMNDDTNLYLALKVPEAPPIENNDIFEIRFDNGNDGVLTDGDDELRLDGVSTFSDTHFFGTFFGVADTTTDGAGSAANDGTFNFFEIAHPLNSGDVNDIAVAPGGTLGFCVRYFNDGASSSPGLDFPGFCVLVVNAQSEYADLTLLPVPAPDRIFGDCTFNLVALRAALTLSGFNGVVDASHIVIYDGDKFNQGHANGAGGFTGPILCSNDLDTAPIVTTETAAIPNPTDHGTTPGDTVDFVDTQQASHLQYTLTTGPRSGKTETRLCHTVFDNTDCFFVIE